MMLLALGMTLPVFSQGLEYVKSNYTKHESYIAMRDGVRLFTAVYIPKDHSQTYPILLTRTPYSIGPYGSDQYRDDLGPSPALAREKYIIVYQDVRGRFMSEGPCRFGSSGSDLFHITSLVAALLPLRRLIHILSIVVDELDV